MHVDVDEVAITVMDLEVDKVANMVVLMEVDKVANKSSQFRLNFTISTKFHNSRPEILTPEKYSSWKIFTPEKHSALIMHIVSLSLSLSLSLFADFRNVPFSIINVYLVQIELKLDLVFSNLL